MEDIIVTLLDGTRISKCEVPIGTIYINEKGVKVKKGSSENDSNNSVQQIGSDFLGFASKAAKKVSTSVAEWNSERIKRQQEEERRLKEEQSGYYFRDGILYVTTLEGMKTWMRELTKDSTPAILQTLQTQLVVLNTIQSPAMIGMALDNIIVCLDKASKCCSSDEEKDNVRESFASMIQNYMFFMEARIRCAQMNSSVEASMLLIQAGGLLSDAIIKTAMVASAKPFDMSKVLVKNIFEQEEYQTSYIKSVFGWLGDAIHLKEKETEYYFVVENLFETVDQYSNLFGKSILLSGMLKRYRKQLVSRKKASLMAKYVDRNSQIDTEKIGSLITGISNAATSWFSPFSTDKIGGTISGAATAIGAAAGLVIDATNDKKKALDLDAFCKLEDSIENEIIQLQSVYNVEQDALKPLEAEYEKLGFLQIAEKKRLQQKIDDKKSQIAKLNDVIIQTKQKFADLKSLFPDSHVINEELNKYEKSLIAIENKFSI